jgi:hypothetical protein
VSDDPEKGDGVTERSGVYSATGAPADLLDLVRDAEDEARLSTKMEIAPNNETAQPDERDRFVDVDDDAVDEPPAPVLDVADPPKAGGAPRSGIADVADPPKAGGAPRSGIAEVEPIAPRARVEARRDGTRDKGPTLGIVALFALAVGVLALLTR